MRVKSKLWDKFVQYAEMMGFMFWTSVEWTPFARTGDVWV